MAGVAAALIVLVTILKLGMLFQELPKVGQFPLFATLMRLSVYTQDKSVSEMPH